MSPQTRTPRQPPGEHLVPLTIHIPLRLRGELEDLSIETQRSVSWLARQALAFWWEHGDLVGTPIAVVVPPA